MNTLNASGQVGWHLSLSLKGKPFGSHMVGQENPIHPDIPTMIGCNIGARVHRKRTVGRVTHPNTILICVLKHLQLHLRLAKIVRKDICVQ